MKSVLAVLDGMYFVISTDLRVRPDPVESYEFLLTVYAHREGRWQQIAWQTTKAPQRSPGRTGKDIRICR